MLFHLTKLEKRRILDWSDYTIYDSLHWGNGAGILPEEEELIKKLKSKEEEINLEKVEINLIYVWGISRLGNGIILLGEDIIILRKILEFYKKIEEIDSSVQDKIENLEKILRQSDG